MTNELVRKNLETSLQLGSLSEVVKDAETIMLLIDTSSSMDERVRTSNRRAIDHLADVVREINPRAAGIPMIAFGGPYDAQCRFVDAVPEPDGGTPLHIAIPMAKEYGANRVVVISDGCPDLSEQCIIEAKAFGGRIDVVYIGTAGDAGDFFLRHLAELTGGTCGVSDVSKTKELVGTVIALLEGEVEAPKAPIQGAGFTTVEADEPDDDDDVDDSDSDEAEADFENDDDDEDEDDEEDDED
jgi:hypothetical protein